MSMNSRHNSLVVQDSLECKLIIAVWVGRI